MDKIVEVLLEKETMSGDEFREILSKYTPESVEIAKEGEQITSAGIMQM